MFKRLRNNFGLKMLAFLLAVVAAVFVKTMAKPIRELPAQRVYTKTIDVLAPNNSNLICSVSPKEVTVAIKGKRNVIERIEPNLISAVIDLSGREKPGNMMEKVDVVAPGGAEVTQIDPPRVWAAVSERVFSSVPVRVNLVGRPDENCRADYPMIEPSKVRIVGGMENVDRVAFVVAPVSITGCNSTFSTKAITLAAVDQAGNKVSDVEIYTSSVLVTVPVYPVRKARVRLDNVHVSGPDSGSYDIKCEPEEVVLGGEGIEESEIGSVNVEPCRLDPGAGRSSQEVRVIVPGKFRLLELPKKCVKVTAVKKEG